MSNNTKLATAPQTTTNYILKATSTTIGNSLVYDDGTGVAIGDTTASGYKFKVNGTLNVTGAATFSSSVTANYGGTFIIPSESPVSGNVALTAKTSNGNNDIFRWYDGTTQLGVFKNSGNVGIGTSSPSATLHVIKDGSGNANSGIVGSLLILSRTIGAAENLAFRNTGTSVGINGLTYTAQIISDGNNGIEMYTTGGQSVVLGTNNTERMRITSGGNLLVGTTTDGVADARLNVAGSIITRSYGGSGSFTTSIPIPSGFGGLFVAKGYNTTNGVSFSVIYNVATRVPGGGGSDVYYILVSQNGVSTTFTFDNNGGFLRINPSANTQWSGTFLGL